MLKVFAFGLFLIEYMIREMDIFNFLGICIFKRTKFNFGIFDSLSVEGIFL